MNQTSEWFKLISQSEGIRIIPASDLKSRIKSNIFLTDLHQTWLTKFVRIDSDEFILDPNFEINLIRDEF